MERRSEVEPFRFVELCGLRRLTVEVAGRELVVELRQLRDLAARVDARVAGAEVRWWRDACESERHEVTVASVLLLAAEEAGVVLDEEVREHIGEFSAALASSVDACDECRRARSAGPVWLS